MNTKSKSLLLFAGISALSLSVAAVAINASKAKPLTIVKSGNSKSVTFTSSQLKNVALEDIDLGGSNGLDKKFRLPLENGNYIDGAIVFRDCGHQYTGSKLGDFFGIDNPISAEANAYNFQILFSFESTVSLKVDFTEVASSNDGSVKSYFQIKYVDKEYVDFYDFIEDNYSKITEVVNSFDASFYTGYYQETILKLDNESSEHAGGGYSKTENDFHFSQSGATVAALQCTYASGEPWNQYYVQKNSWIKFGLDSLSFEYNCN